MTSAVRVTMQHVRAAGYCSAGMRTFLQRHDLNLTTFLQEGLPIEVFEATGDALALRVCAIARNEAVPHG